MAKQSRDFPTKVDISVPLEVRLQLLAIAYHMGAGGAYATPGRNFLAKGIRDYVANLKGQDIKDYHEILENVKLMEESKDKKQKSPAV